MISIVGRGSLQLSKKLLDRGQRRPTSRVAGLLGHGQNQPVLHAVGLFRRSRHPPTLCVAVVIGMF